MITKTSVVLVSLVAVGLPLNAQDKCDVSKMDVSKLPPVADKKNVTYTKDIRPLFEA